MEMWLAPVLQGIYEEKFPSRVHNFILKYDISEIAGAIGNFYPFLIIVIKNQSMPLFFQIRLILFLLCLDCCGF